MDDHGRSRTITDDHGRSRTITDDHGRMQTQRHDIEDARASRRAVLVWQRTDTKTVAREGLWVRIPPPAPDTHPSPRCWCPKARGEERQHMRLIRGRAGVQRAHMPTTGSDPLRLGLARGGVERLFA